MASGYADGGPAGYLTIGFLVPAGVYSVSVGVVAHGYGLGSTGEGQAYGSALAELNGMDCGLGLSGGIQSCNGLVAVYPGELATFYLSAVLAAVSYAYDAPGGSSATINYWGTFTPTLEYYNASGNPVRGYPFPSPPTPSVPEPASIVLFGSAILGLAARRVRRFWLR